MTATKALPSPRAPLPSGCHGRGGNGGPHRLEGKVQPSTVRGGIARFSGVCAERVSGSPVAAAAARRILSFSQLLCRTQSASRPVCHQSTSPLLGILSPGISGLLSSAHQLINMNEINSSVPNVSTIARDEANRPAPGQHQAGQGPLNLEIPRPGSRGCVSVSECRQTMPVAVARWRWSVSPLPQMEPLGLFGASVWGITASLHHPRRDKILPIPFFFSPSPFLSRRNSKESRTSGGECTASVGPWQELSPKPSPFPHRSNHKDLALCAGLRAVGTRGWNPIRVDLSP